MRGKTVVVTGGSRGIGKAICIAFAREGANIVLNYRSTKPDEVVSEITSLGVQCLALKADVSKFEEANQLILAAKDKFDTIDVLVNNAGITKDMLIMRMSESQFDDVISTNLKGSFNTIRHVSNIMLKQKSGTIINISSIVGITGNAGQCNYSASKAGLIGLTKSVALELASRNITCNVIAPGFIETDMTEGLSEKVKRELLGKIPLNSLGSPEDVATTAVFLAKSNYITGQVISVNGGLSM